MPAMDPATMAPTHAHAHDQPLVVWIVGGWGSTTTMAWEGDEGEQ
jgi:hypothetical protein